ncbi:TetR/AcrR family transcriptional regulator [Halopseudomonas formosensis]|uniref:TetR/AcrR family transcriptional regulator n=1 Tax=Halopseudomonas formosensis TaxID=1002526 RepID=A0ABU5C104_9GAMM|nr:TetR/AcrR family transcriptional regulator [Halopseudomonas formosensis]MDX9688308.1 TetR/AcrR family transcriptional regulator [Halopseudomonas formosensis]
MDILERSYPGRRAELKRAILRAGLECFNAQGIEATTIEMIRSGSDTSVGAIYHHFGNKEGLVAALLFAAMEDQASLRQQYLATAQTPRDGVSALVLSYVDWVADQPEWARYQFNARFVVANGPHKEELVARNRARNQQLQEWFARAGAGDKLTSLPYELVPSLIIGPAESYCRAWLSGRVASSPRVYRETLAEAAWRALGVA